MRERVKKTYNLNQARVAFHTGPSLIPPLVPQDIQNPNSQLFWILKSRIKNFSELVPLKVLLILDSDGDCDDDTQTIVKFGLFWSHESKIQN